MTLISATEIAALRGVVESGMESTVVIKRLTTSEADFGDATAFTTVATVKGWLREITTVAAGIGEVGGVTAVAETHRLFVPVGTDLRSGDIVLVNGESFRVQHTDASSTYLTHLTAILRRSE